MTLGGGGAPIWMPTTTWLNVLGAPARNAPASTSVPIPSFQLNFMLVPFTAIRLAVRNASIICDDYAPQVSWTGLRLSLTSTSYNYLNTSAPLLLRSVIGKVRLLEGI
jgi:hypothetical protein